MATKLKEYDEFFDTPRSNHDDCNISTDFRLKDTHDDSSVLFNDSKFREPIGKPPTHPNSRPGSAASKLTYSDSTSPTGDHTGDDRCIKQRQMEARLPSVAREPTYDDYSDDSFIQDDNESSDEDNSGRRCPSLDKFVAQEEQSKLCALQGQDGEKDRKHDYSDNSCDSFSDDGSDVTDVSPLNTPHVGHESESASGGYQGNRIKSRYSEGVGLMDANSDSVDLDKLLEAVLHMEKQEKTKQPHLSAQPTSSAPQRARKNYSFTNEQLRAIDKENERLLKNILKYAKPAKKGKLKSRRSSAPVHRPTTHFSRN